MDGFSELDSDSKTMDVVIVVTGGTGFLGRHIVHHLVHETSYCHAWSVKEIRIYDIQSAEWVEKLERTSGIKITTIIGDVRDRKQLDFALESASIVIHTAAIVDVLGKYSEDFIMDVNINGTVNVIDSCIKNGVTVLVYTSSAEVVMPNDKENEVNECSDNDVKSLWKHTEPYPLSKSIAEKHVLDADNTLINKGIYLSTCVLRPVGIYGEHCPILKAIYKLCVKSKINYKCSRDNAPHSRVYAGNVATMHVLAARKMFIQGRDSGICKNIYYCYDNSPLEGYQEFNMHFLGHLGIELRDVRIPRWLLIMIAYMNKLIQKLVSPFYSYTPLLNPYTLMMECTQTSIHTNKAERDFGYTPRFSWEDSRERTIQWLESLDRFS